MARTTLDIDGPVLRELRALHQREGRSMGRIASDLLSEALAYRKKAQQPSELRWVARPMGALVDLSDKEAVYAVLDRHASLHTRSLRQRR